MQQRPIPPPPRPPPAPQGMVPPATPGTFDRDIFLLRQKHLSIKEKYYVADEHGRTIFYAERPQHVARNLLAMIVGVVAAIVVGIALGSLASSMSGTLEAIFATVAVIGAFVVLIVVSVALSKKRHVLLYVDDTKQQQLLEIQQDKKIHFLRATYTVAEPNGTVVARLITRFIHGLLRKRWDAYDAAGNHLCVIREDSIAKAIARRLFGPLFGALRTNFLILTPQEQQLGAFNREWTLFDRYVLDMRMDASRTLDRKIALAIGLMLDTGEKR